MDLNFTMSNETNTTVNITTGVEFNCLVRENLSSSEVSNSTAWTIQESLLYGTPYVATVILIFFLLSFFWNLFIIITFLVKYNLLKQPGNIILLNLAITDLLISVMVLLFSMVTEIAQEFVFGSTDLVRCGLCDTAGFFFLLLFQISIHSLAALSLDRFIHLTRPLNYKHIMKPWRAIVIIISIWVISFVLAVLPLVGFGQIEFNRNFGACVQRFTGENADSGLQNFYYVAFSTLWDLIPVVFLFVTNIWTYKFVSKFLKRNFRRASTYRREDKKTGDNKNYHKQQRQLAKVFSALLVSSMISWTPVLCVIFLIIFIPADDLPNEVYTFGWICYLTTPVFHPILESLFVKDLRYQVTRAKTSVQRAGSAILKSSTNFFFSDKALEEANEAMDERPDRPSTRRIVFFKPHTRPEKFESNTELYSISTAIPSPNIERKSSLAQKQSSHPRKLHRKITFSDDIDSNKPAMPPVDEETQTVVSNGPTTLANHIHVQIDVHEESIQSTAEVETVTIRNASTDDHSQGDANEGTLDDVPEVSNNTSTPTMPETLAQDTITVTNSDSNHIQSTAADQQTGNDHTHSVTESGITTANEIDS